MPASRKPFVLVKFDEEDKEGLRNKGSESRRKKTAVGWRDLVVLLCLGGFVERLSSAGAGPDGRLCERTGWSVGVGSPPTASVSAQHGGASRCMVFR
jgi:hypothetical protein